MSDERVTDLEIKIAYQEQVIESLSSVVREFALRVERLERRVDQIVEGNSAAGEIGPGLEKPPHY